MVKYSKEFKEQALLLSDEIGVKKVGEQLGINYHTITDWRKLRSREAREARIVSDKSPLNERACDAAGNTGAEKSEVNMGQSKKFRQPFYFLKTKKFFYAKIYT